MITNLLETLHVSLDDSDSEISQAVKDISLAYEARKNALETLVFLFESAPCFDGDLPSKKQRDWLISHGLASKIIVCGQEGYQALNYYGGCIYRVIMKIKEIEE